jgi:hypothetical protein
MNLPADKVVIQNVPVVAVRFQQVPNPAFAGSGSSLGQTSSTQSSAQPAYVQGDIQTITILVPRPSLELLTFGLDNGRIHVALLPAQTAHAANGAQAPTFGITFNDVLAWMMRERGLTSAGNPTQAAVSQPTPLTGPTAKSTPAVGGTATATTPASAIVTPVPPTASPKPTVSPTTIATGLDFTVLLAPLSCGIVLLVLFVVAVRFIRKRRHDDNLV